MMEDEDKMFAENMRDFLAFINQPLPEGADPAAPVTFTFQKDLKAT